MAYKLVKELARGGFGRVDLVRNGFNVEFARKTFDPESSPLVPDQLRKMRDRFKREINIQRSLKSELALPILEFELKGDHPWYIMPLASRTFEEEIRLNAKSPSALKEPLSQILNALEELHDLGYVHRDLKPANVLLHEGKWKLSDFGLAMPPRSVTSALTSTNSAWGSQHYCPPEQVIDFKRTTCGADIYAFGAILHDIFGEGPDARVPFSKLSCNGPIGVIIEKCTEREVPKRFPSIRALRAALLRILAVPQQPRPSRGAAEWLSRMSLVSTWDDDEARRFCRFTEREATDDDITSLCYGLDEGFLEQLKNLDSDAFSFFAEKYCDWGCGRSFDFTYCDVIGRRFQEIFQLGDIGIKARAAVAAAKLGSSHNRFFVMAITLALCAPDADEHLARRVGIEITACDAAGDFLSCAQVIGHSVEDYHPLVAEAIQNQED